ncbi:WecB/TagA/CpsF family glycosyltransferase [Altererythrobacter salegens]|uniref:WecB/TagA/CpsF family glycosyltransferase n=2 Tax=Croceibacterium salegens TaxID=1737568 RepID=A0A6I4SZQ1_9SPHN|nr:WecB/TagA/CpsF family glycosyltransferase [Croceibacterium salegens]
MLARSLGISLCLVPGSDLTLEYLDDDRSKPISLAVIGGDLDLIKKLNARYPTHHWHHHLPPMGVRWNRRAQKAIIRFVEERAAEVYFFAIGSPQSELLCAEIFRRGKASGVAICVGASLEFLVGAKKRAPRWVQKMAFEWLYRLLSEPTRLWRRYLIEGPSILRIWWQYRTNTSRAPVEFDSNSPGTG